MATLFIIIVLKLCTYIPLTVQYESTGLRQQKPVWINNKKENYHSILKATRKNCWMTMNAKHHFEQMDELDEKYSEARERFQNDVNETAAKFANDTLQTMYVSRGKLQYVYEDIPAGLNLGGQSMMRMQQSILFFHRMKLRNNTRFRINSLKPDLYNMRITAQLSLHDLHLLGSYERAITDKHKPSVLYYVPTYGQLEILLKNVQYKLEGRLRLLRDNPYIVLTTSEIDFDDALLVYQNNATHTSQPIHLSKESIGEFLERMKSDLDEWLRDYFNEHLMTFNEVGSNVNTQLRQYEKTKAVYLNNYVEEALLFIKAKINDINATEVRLPSFSIFAQNGVALNLYEGTLRGLDTIYRRSVATGGSDGKIRKVDAIVGFSNLKMVYKYTALLTAGVPPLGGLMTLMANELTAHMALSLVKDAGTVDLNFDLMKQLRPESLTIEGAANRMIANYKHILEHHIISMMSNSLIHNIRTLRTLVKCRPNLFGHTKNNGFEDEFDKSAVDEVENQEIIKHDKSTKEIEDADNKSAADENSPLNEENKSGIETEKITQQLDEASNSQQHIEGDDVERNDDIGLNKDPPNKTPDYIVNRVDSIEMDVPSNTKTGRSNKFHINYLENLNISKIN